MGTHRAPYNGRDPLLREFFRVIDRSPRKLDDLMVEAGVDKNTLCRLRNHKTASPRLFVLQWLLATVGYELKIVKKTSNGENDGPGLDATGRDPSGKHHSADR